MTMPVVALPKPPREEGPLTEAELIGGRVASARRWAKRRRMLRLRAALFGRAKLRGAGIDGEEAGLRLACN